MSASSLVAIVDDDVFLLDALDNLLRSAGFVSRGFVSAASFLSRPFAQVFDLVITDYQMTSMNGLELIAALRTIGDKTPVIMMSGNDSPTLERRAIEAGAVGVLWKPFDADSLIEMVERSIFRRPPGRNGAG